MMSDDKLKEVDRLMRRRILFGVGGVFLIPLTQVFHSLIKINGLNAASEHPEFIVVDNWIMLKEDIQ